MIILTPWPLFPLERTLGNHRIGACGERRAATGILKREIIKWRLSGIEIGLSRNLATELLRFLDTVSWGQQMECTLPAGPIHCRNNRSLEDDNGVLSLKETVNRSKHMVHKSNIKFISVRKHAMFHYEDNSVDVV